MHHFFSKLLLYRLLVRRDELKWERVEYHNIIGQNAFVVGSLRKLTIMIARLNTPPTIQPIKLMLNAVCLSKDLMRMDTNAGPSPFPRSSKMLTRAFARPLKSGRQTLVNIDRSSGTGITTN